MTNQVLLLVYFFLYTLMLLNKRAISWSEKNNEKMFSYVTKIDKNKN